MIEITPFQKTIDRLKTEGKYRVFNDILRERGEYPNAIWYGPYNIKNIVKLVFKRLSRHGSEQSCVRCNAHSS